MTPLPAPPSANEGLLESFLLDMDALDHQQSSPVISDTKNTSKKRKMDDSFGLNPPESTILPKKKKPSWLKRKNELQALRQLTQAMETRVAYLNMRKSSPTGGLNAFELHKLTAEVLAEKQRRQDAQSENQQLQAKLQKYTRQYEAFQMILAEFQQKELLQMFGAALRVEMGTGQQIQVGSIQVFDTMERRLDARFYELEQAYCVMQQPMTSSDTSYVETRTDEAVEFTRLELLPFDEKAISTTMWSFIEEGKFPDGEHSIACRCSENCFGVSSRVTVQMDCGGVVTIESHSVMKRIVKVDGFATMVESCSKWTVDSPTSGSWNHTTREGGCFVTRRYSPDGGDSPGMCQARSVLWLHTGEPVDKSKCLSRAKPKSLKEVVVPSFRQLTNSRHQFVENALFDTIRT